jgi:methyl-accepting chemotaxis protein
MIATLDPEQTIGRIAESSADSLNRLAGNLAPIDSAALKLQAFQTAVHMLSLHQLSVLSAQGTEDLAEIAQIWSRPLTTFEEAFDKISQLIDRLSLRSSDLDNLLNVIADLRDQARWAYELHASGNLQATD